MFIHTFQLQISTSHIRVIDESLKHKMASSLFYLISSDSRIDSNQ